MRFAIRKGLLAAALLIFFSIAVQAADDAPKPENNWDNLQRLHAGQKVDVVDQKLKTHRGEFTSFDDSGVTIAVKNGPLRLSRQDVFRVSSRERSKRLRNAAIGAAIGAAAGLAIGAPLDYRFSNEGNEHIAKTLFIPIGAGVGAALGSAVPGFETIYRAPKK